MAASLRLCCVRAAQAWTRPASARAPWPRRALTSGPFTRAAGDSGTEPTGSSSGTAVDPADPLKALEGNPFLAKYKERLAQAAKKQGKASLVRAHQQQHQQQQQVEEAAKRQGRPAAPPATATATATASGGTGPQPRGPGLDPTTLDYYMKTELLEGLSGDDISQLWQDYHKNQDCIAASIPVDKYKRLMDKARDNPFFVFPVPRDEGAEMFLSQFVSNQCAFTLLSEFQLHQEKARPVLTMTHFSELAGRAGLVLMRGEIDLNRIAVHDAQFLALQLQLAYFNDGLFSLVETMNHRPAEFDYNKVMEAFNDVAQLGGRSQ